MTLRIITDEVVVPDKRLGRHVNHDPRSKMYAFQPAQAVTRVSVRHKRNAPVFNQGDLGSCTGNACLGALATSPIWDDLMANGSVPVYTEEQAVSLYSLATTLDGFDGSYPPDDTGSDGLSVAKAAKQHGWLSGYQHALSADAALDALVSGPIIVGVDWYEGFDSPKSTGEMVLSGAVRGGHELCVDEIDVENQRVWVTNSWGTSWALSGRAWWSWATFARLLKSDGDATILVPITAPAPVPVPPSPQPTPGAASFPGATPAVDSHIARAAVKAGLSTTDYQNHRWANYFGIKP